MKEKQRIREKEKCNWQRSGTQTIIDKQKKSGTERTCREKERGGHTKTFARALGAIIQVASNRKKKVKWKNEARYWNSPKMN